MSEWLDEITTLLRSGFGPNEPKREVYAVAKQMDELEQHPVPNALRSWFRAWVHGMRWLEPDGEPWKKLDRELPPLEPIPRETDAHRNRRLDDREKARLRRIQRYVLWRRNGFEVGEARACVCTEEEAAEGEREYRRQAVA